MGLTCTNGRFSYLKRLLTCFLNQDYENKSLLIFNNAHIPIEIENFPQVNLINNYLDYNTGELYDNVGSIYRDALTHITDDVELVSIMDDDDIFLPNHFFRAEQIFVKHDHVKVWKPGKYFYKDFDGITLGETDNNLEGACVIDRAFLVDTGFHLSSLEYNLKWLNRASMTNSLFIDRDALPSFCYDVSQVDVVHTGGFSSKFGDDKPTLEYLIQQNNNYGNEKLTPWRQEVYAKYIDMFFNLEDYY